MSLTWRAWASDGANYVRQEIELTAVESDCALQRVTWLREPVPGAQTIGQVDGSVVRARSFFFGCEDPHAQNQAGVAPNQVLCQLQRNAVVKRGESMKVSFVVGVAPGNERRVAGTTRPAYDQFRRAFLYYLERERAHPYRQFLHNDPSEDMGNIYQQLAGNPEGGWQATVLTKNGPTSLRRLLLPFTRRHIKRSSGSCQA